MPTKYDIIISQAAVPSGNTGYDLRSCIVTFGLACSVFLALMAMAEQGAWGLNRLDRMVYLYHANFFCHPYLLLVELAEFLPCLSI
jgi:hypothetical protein